MIAAIALLVVMVFWVRRIRRRGRYGVGSAVGLIACSLLVVFLAFNAAARAASGGAVSGVAVLREVPGAWRDEMRAVLRGHEQHNSPTPAAGITPTRPDTAAPPPAAPKSALIQYDPSRPSACQYMPSGRELDECLRTAKTTQWTYYVVEDKMSGRAARQAAVKSTNTLEFRFPYQNPQHATLLLRAHPRYGKNVIVEIERGQFLCPSYDGCAVLVRFDEGSATKYSAFPPADHSSDAVFIQNYQSFVSRMLKVTRVRIEAEFYQEGSPTLDFDVSGFDEAKYNPEPQPKQKAKARD